MSKYRRWYLRIIERATGRLLNGYAERHHIVPRALGGGNEASNIVRLTYREHFLAHWLLTKMTTGAERKKMQYALHRMSGRFEGRIIAGWQYDVARRSQREARIGTKQSPDFVETLSKRMKGNQYGRGIKKSSEQIQEMRARLAGNKHSLGFKHSIETLAKRGPASDATRQKMSAAHRARWSVKNDRSVSAETRAKMSASAKSKAPPSTETRARLSASLRAYWVARKGQST